MDIFTAYFADWVRFTTPDPFGPFGPHGKFKVLLAKISRLKQKTKSNTSSYYRKNPILSFREDSLWFLQITMGKCKTKANQIDLGIIRHNEAYSGIIQAYSSIFKTLCNPGIFRIVVHAEP